SFFFLLSIQYVYVRRILLLLEYRKVKSFPFLHSLAFHVQSGCKSNYLFLINKTFYAFFEKKSKVLFLIQKTIMYLKSPSPIPNEDANIKLFYQIMQEESKDFYPFY